VKKHVNMSNHSREVEFPLHFRVRKGNDPTDLPSGQMNAGSWYNLSSRPCAEDILHKVVLACSNRLRLRLRAGETGLMIEGLLESEAEAKSAESIVAEAVADAQLRASIASKSSEQIRRVVDSVLCKASARNE
jgi:hypothetical protein